MNHNPSHKITIYVYTFTVIARKLIYYFTSFEIKQNLINHINSKNKSLRRTPYN